MEQVKIWGTTESLINTPFVQIHRIKFRQGGVCSTHYHQSRNNLFYVIRGRLEIVTPFGDTELGPGESLVIRPGLRHHFVGLMDGEALELYYPEPVRTDDIVRNNQGYRLNGDGTFTRADGSIGGKKVVDISA